MNYIKKPLIFLTIIAVSLLGMVLLFYFMAPVYKFSGPVPFEGNKLYNPYAGMNPILLKLYQNPMKSRLARIEAAKVRLIRLMVFWDTTMLYLPDGST